MVQFEIGPIALNMGCAIDLGLVLSSAGYPRPLPAIVTRNLASISDAALYDSVPARSLVF